MSVHRTGALFLGAALVVASHAAAAAPRNAVVVIEGMKFGPVPSDLRAGDSITWVNRDIFRHTATAAGAFDVDLKPGARARTRLKAPGKLLVRCKYHPGMRASLSIGR